MWYKRLPKLATAIGTRLNNKFLKKLNNESCNISDEIKKVIICNLSDLIYEICICYFMYKWGQMLSALNEF
jgi:hypothetical protein